MPAYRTRKSDTDNIQFYTRSLPALLDFYYMFYLDGVKRKPSNLEDVPTPIGLAFWAMDDGSSNKYGFYLNTHSFMCAQ